MTKEVGPTLSVKEMARYLGIGENLAYRMVAENEVPHARLGDRIIISRTVLDQMLEGTGDAS
jgi:excisionase family DNA binding protein